VPEASAQACHTIVVPYGVPLILITFVWNVSKLYIPAIVAVKVSAVALVTVSLVVKYGLLLSENLPGGAKRGNDVGICADTVCNKQASIAHNKIILFINLSLNSF